MPSTVRSLIRAAALAPEGCLRWGEPVPEDGPGVYLVSLDADPDSLGGCLSECPVSTAAIEELLRTRAELTLDGARPDVAQLAKRLAAFWLPDEVVLYIGRAGSSLTARVDQYYRTGSAPAAPTPGAGS